MNISMPKAKLTSMLVNLSITGARLISMREPMLIRNTLMSDFPPILTNIFPWQYWHVRSWTSLLLEARLTSMRGSSVCPRPFYVRFPRSRMNESIPGGILTSTLARRSITEAILTSMRGIYVCLRHFMLGFPPDEQNNSYLCGLVALLVGWRCWLVRGAVWFALLVGLLC